MIWLQVVPCASMAENSGLHTSFWNEPQLGDATQCREFGHTTVDSRVRSQIHSNSRGCHHFLAGHSRIHTYVSSAYVFRILCRFSSFMIMLQNDALYPLFLLVFRHLAPRKPRTCSLCNDKVKLSALAETEMIAFSMMRNMLTAYDHSIVSAKKVLRFFAKVLSNGQ